MEERYLGRSGLRVSLVGLGTNNFGARGGNFDTMIDPDQTRAIIHKALDLGVTHIDTADSYGKRGGSEEALGVALGEHRKDFVLGTKFGNPMDDAGRLRGGSRRYMISAVEASLRRLRTDWIDVLTLHFPDPATPIEETIGAFDQLIRDGKIRYAGISNVAAWQVAEAALVARELKAYGPVAVQDEYSLFARQVEKEVLPVCQRYGIGFVPFYPLAAGLLTGKYKREQAPPPGSRFATSRRAADKQLSPERWDALQQMEALAGRSGRTMLELAMGWLASRNVASIIAGATSPAQLEQNVLAAGCKLTPEEIAELDEITAGFG